MADPNSFSHDRGMEILRRAIELDLQDPDAISEAELRSIAAELDVRPEAFELALKQYRGEIRANPPAPPGVARQWAIPALTLSIGAVAAIVFPEALTDPALVGAYLGFLGLSALPAWLLIWSDRRRRRMRIGIDGVRYASRSGEKILKWANVLKITPLVPGSVTITSPNESVILVLADFGDPDAVLAAIRLRIAEATSTGGKPGAS